LPRAIDHLVIAAHDLDALAALYRRLGFQVGPRNRHPWGTENHIVQFGGSFLELIGLGEGFVAPPPAPGVFSFAGFVARFLARRQGVAMLALGSGDAEADRVAFAGAEIGDFARFDFARKGRRPDGGEVSVAFSLAFAQDREMPEAGFFVSQHHFPENFWSARVQVHANGAQAITGLVAVSERPQDHVDFLKELIDGRQASPIEGGFAFVAKGATIEVLTPRAIALRYGANALAPDAARLAVVRIGVKDLHATRVCLTEANAPFASQDGALVLAAHEAMGAVLVFERAASRK
jgi:Glyoxalase-like domain